MTQQKKPTLPDAFKVRETGRTAPTHIQRYAEGVITTALRRRGMEEAHIDKHVKAVRNEMRSIDQSYVTANILQEMPPLNRRPV